MRLLLTMIIGALVPQAHAFSFLMQYLLMAMLFFAFLDIEFKPQILRRVIWVLLGNIALAFLSYAVLAPFNRLLALTAFMTAIAPTAIAAPVITGYVQGQVEYVVACVVSTNISSAFIIPAALPSLLGTRVQISVLNILRPVLVVMLVPLIFARLSSRLTPHTQNVIRKGKPLSFPIWLVNLFIISANASFYLHSSETAAVSTLIAIALVSLVICVVNFGTGVLLGGRIRWQEAGQSLGHKNLSFVIWIALTFIDPLVALGPMCYLVYHHLYNAWLIQHFEKHHTRIRAKETRIPSSRQK